MLLSDAVNRDRFVCRAFILRYSLSKILHTERNDVSIIININCFDIRYFESVIPLSLYVPFIEDTIL